MHLRHIDPRSTDWMDAMVDEGKAELEAAEMERGDENAKARSSLESGGGDFRGAPADAPPR